MLQNNSAEKKLRLKICQILVPLPEKISDNAADMKISFHKAFYVFFGSNVFVFS